MDTKKTVLYLIRHGQTEGNTRYIYQGQLNTDLTELGRTQAKLMGKRLSEIEPDAVYSSDLGRALETAEIACRVVDVEIQVRKGLRERNFGVFQGKPRTQVKETYPEAYALYRGKDPDFRIPDGESWSEFVRRIETSLTEIAREHTGSTVAVFTHGGVIGSFFTHQLGLSVQPALEKFAIPNGGFTKYEYHTEAFKLLSFSDTHHLDYKS